MEKEKTIDWLNKLIDKEKQHLNNLYKQKEQIINKSKKWYSFIYGSQLTTLFVINTFIDSTLDWIDRYERIKQNYEKE